MKKRTITAVIMILILAPLLILPKLFIGLQIVIGLLSLVAFYELISNDNSNYDFKTKITSFILLALSYISFVWYKGSLDNININNLFNYKIVMIVMITSFTLYLYSVLNELFNIKDVSKVLTYILYITFGLGSLVILRINGVQFIIYLFLTTSITDIFAYMFGVKFGKNKLAPNISPNKSWEGAIIGTISATLIIGSVGTFYGYIFKGNVFNPNNYTTIFDGIKHISNLNMVGKGIIVYLLTFILSVVGQMGDLFASKIKRLYDIKDFGYIFPGHGGVLDRFDSAMFASMFLVIVISLLTLI